MIGAIAGDVIGSVHERAGTKTKDFPLFDECCRFTDGGLNLQGSVHLHRQSRKGDIRFEVVKPDDGDMARPPLGGSVLGSNFIQDAPNRCDRPPSFGTQVQ
ncbi:MAG: hypothetical protein ACK5OC_24220 [Pirellula sp.]|jgi:hypothetical protein